MITSCCNGEEGMKHSIASRMVENFECYWNYSCNVLAIASVLDPRTKMVALTYYFPIIYGEDYEKRKISDFHMHLVDLYNKYQLPKSVRESHKSVNEESSSASTYLTTLLKCLDIHIAENRPQQGRKTDLELYLLENLLSHVRMA